MRFMIGILFILFSLLCISTWVARKYYKIAQFTEQVNYDTRELNNEIRLENEEAQKKLDELKQYLELAKLEYQHQQEKIKDLKNIAENMNENANKAFEQYCDVLDEAYISKEREYKELENNLNRAYSQEQIRLEEEYDKRILELNTEVANTRADLNKLIQTRAAAIQAKLDEEKLKEDASFYMLSIPIENLKDAKVLRDIEYKLNNPRTLRMLIWKDFYQKPMNTLCANVLGTEAITGIYKITNQDNDMCYIGQAVDIATRWKQHAKCGLGIDTPVTNKLYPAMQKYGLENFTFELLEECDAIELNEKEKFYIDLYKSYEYGYNSNKGVS